MTRLFINIEVGQNLNSTALPLSIRMLSFCIDQLFNQGPFPNRYAHLHAAFAIQVWLFRKV